MKIIYDDYGGAHSTPVAAAIHLGIMDPSQVPSDEQLMALPLFDRVTRVNHGCVVFMGTDSNGHEVYVLGRGSLGVAMERAVACGAAMVGGSSTGVLFVDTLCYVNIWMRIGGFLSRALGLISLGRPLVLYGTRKAFPFLARLVGETKRRIASEAGSGRIVASTGVDLTAVAECAVQRGILDGITTGPFEPLSGVTRREE